MQQANKVYKWACPVNEPDSILQSLSGQSVIIVSRYLTGGALVRFLVDDGMTDVEYNDLSELELLNA